MFSIECLEFLRWLHGKVSVQYRLASIDTPSPASHFSSASEYSPAGNVQHLLDHSGTRA